MNILNNIEQINNKYPYQGEVLKSILLDFAPIIEYRENTDEFRCFVFLNKSRSRFKFFPINKEDLKDLQAYAFSRFLDKLINKKDILVEFNFKRIGLTYRGFLKVYKKVLIKG